MQLVGANKIFKIYRYVTWGIDKSMPPVGLNYKTGMAKNLFPKRTFVKGELQKVEWFADEAMTDLIIDVLIAYDRDELSFAWSRTTERRWYLENGEVGIIKTTKKLYDSITTIKEGVVRRGNIYEGMKFPTMGLIAQTETNGDGELARQLGQAFLTEHKADFDNFIDHSDPEILNTILNDSRVWLDNAFDEYGTTIRQYLYSEFDIWT